MLQIQGENRVIKRINFQHRIHIIIVLSYFAHVLNQFRSFL